MCMPRLWQHCQITSLEKFWRVCENSAWMASICAKSCQVCDGGEKITLREACCFATTLPSDKLLTSFGEKSGLCDHVKEKTHLHLIDMHASVGNVHRDLRIPGPLSQPFSNPNWFKLRYWQLPIWYQHCVPKLANLQQRWKHQQYFFISLWIFRLFLLVYMYASMVTHHSRTKEVSEMRIKNPRFDGNVYCHARWKNWEKHASFVNVHVHQHSYHNTCLGQCSCIDDTMFVPIPYKFTTVNNQWKSS